MNTIKEKTIGEILEENIIEKAYSIANEIRNDLHLSENTFIIRCDNDELITLGKLISVQFSYHFKVDSGNTEMICRELNEFGVNQTDIYVEETTSTDDGFEEFYLDVDSIIYFKETLIDNKKRLMKLKGFIEYLVGKYSYEL